MIFRSRHLIALAAAASLALLRPAPCRAQIAAVREYLDSAKAAAFQVPDPAEQSAAFGGIALILVGSDPAAALDLAARTRLPSTAARTLGAAALVLSQTDPVSAAQDVVTAGRLVLRISDPDQRIAEQQLLLREIAPLGDAALPAGPELTPGEAQLEVVLSLAQSDPTAALALLTKWQLRETAYERAAAAISDHLAVAYPDQALTLASSILSARERDKALWRIAEQRPPEEAEGIASRVTDPITQSGMLRSAAVRMAAQDPEAALRVAGSVAVAATSARAEIAVALASTNEARAIEMARGMPGLARRWALERIAVTLAASNPGIAQELLREVGARPEVVRLAAAAMARSDPDRAIALARSAPAGEQRDAALAFVARALVGASPAQAKELLWEMGPSPWRTIAVSAVATALAPASVDEATGLIGLVADPGEAARIRAAIGTLVAGRDPAAAERLLGSLPASQAKTEAALDAAINVLAAGGQQEVAVRLGSSSLARDLAIRWMVPSLAYAQTRSPIALAGEIGTPYLRAMALIDVAREVLDLTPRPRPAPGRAAQIRPIVEWEGME